MIISSRLLIVFCTAFSYLDNLSLSQEQEHVEDQPVEEKGYDMEVDPLEALGEPRWARLRPGWSLTVNDQCLYEFVFQFEHDNSLPVGDDEFKDKCSFGGVDKYEEPKIAKVDGYPYLQPRRMWEKFPDYVWATLGFNHLSIDWLPCGRRPKGYTTPQYDFSFFRVTPEYRAQTMVCKLIKEDEVAVPGEEICDSSAQDEPNGMNFFILPAAIIDRTPVVNMPFTFERPDHGYGPIPHYGLRSWDQSNVPNSPKDWRDIPIFMSSYSGNVAMWQAHLPFKFISGDESQFHSGSERYYETTLRTLPDTWAVDYDERERMIRFIMVGKAGICRGDFERAQEAAGGAPIFPNYDDLFAKSDEVGGTGTDGDIATDNEVESSESHCCVSTSYVIYITLMFLGYIFGK